MMRTTTPQTNPAHSALVAAGLLAALAVAALPGCSGTGAAMTGLSVFQNTQSNKLDLGVYLDGQEAKRNELEQAAKGYSKWKIAGRVSTSPRLRFTFKKPDALGRIRTITVSIFQEFKGKYSDKAEFTVISRSSESTAQMQPNTEYDLGNPGPAFRVTDFYDKEVAGVALKPGMKYMLVLTVAAESSESAQVYFETK